SVLTGNRYVGSNPTLSVNARRRDVSTSRRLVGQVGERLKPPVSKTGMPARASRVRIPPCPSSSFLLVPGRESFQSVEPVRPADLRLAHGLTEPFHSAVAAVSRREIRRP